jgi:hypothetical protein
MRVPTVRQPCHSGRWETIRYVSRAAPSPCARQRPAELREQRLSQLSTAPMTMTFLKIELTYSRED